MRSIAVIGYGVVGSGVVEVIYNNAEVIERKLGEKIEVKYILDLRDFPDSPYATKFIKDFNIILNDPEVSVVAEMITNAKVAYEYTKQALSAGKSVVTSSKAVVAQYGAELLALAREHNAAYLFEASVGGGIPIIRPMHQCLAANEIDEVEGILNGTTNYILTKMFREKLSFEDALGQAQANGYAELNPAADVEGLDTCRKICILASLAFGRHVYPDRVHTEGITSMSLQDMDNLNQADMTVKLLGRAYRKGDQLFAMVCPCAISHDHPLANVEDVFNAILVKGNATGDVMFYGKGAGKLPTASAVVADIIDVCKNGDRSKDISWKAVDVEFVSDYQLEKTAFYLRTEVTDRRKALNYAKKLFGNVRVFDGAENELCFITETALENQLAGKLEAFSQSAEVSAVKNKIRVL
ncbi:MAG: homoserine dehydrogenase [Clostridia bacterium]|nr:homoserine dehydrogenase [Clostridia bacterium]